MGQSFDIFLGNDQLIVIPLLTDVDGVPITTGTVTAQFKAADGTDIGSLIPMNHVGAGRYEGLKPDDLPVSNNQNVTVEVIADDGPGRRGAWVIPGRVQTRGIC